MGRDKAFVEVAGRPLVSYPRDALVGAGAVEVVAVGGDGARLAELGMRAIGDDQPGSGPLGGLVTGLRVVEADVAVVLTCDQPAVTSSLVLALLGGLRRASDDQTGGDVVDVAVALVGGVRHALTAAYRTRAVSALSRRFAAGERSPRRAIEELVVVDVEVPEEEALDLDSPDELRRYASDVTEPG
jgi:molybdenum cofactor guanylyltransferase